MLAAARQAATARTGQVSAKDPGRIATTAPSPAWSVLECRTVTERPSGDSSTSATARAATSLRRSIPAKPSRMIARSRAPISVEASMLSTSRRSSATLAAVALRGPDPDSARWRRRALIAVRAAFVSGRAAPARRWADRTAARARSIELGALPSAARWAT